MSQNNNSKSVEFHCAHLGADAVTANFTADWRGWGKLDLSTVKPTMETVHNAMERAGLAYTPFATVATWYNPLTGKTGENPDYKHVFNPAYDAPIALVGADFNILSFEETLNGIFGEAISEGMTPARFISFDNGARMLAQFALPNEYYTAGRPVKAFFSVYTALTGKVLTRGGMTQYNPVCCNTFAAALYDLTVGTKRTKFMVDRLPSMADKIGIIRREFQESVKVIDSWGIKPADSQLTTAFIKAMLPKPEGSESKAVDNRRESLRVAIGQTANELSGGNGITIYDLFSGVTRMVGARWEDGQKSDADKYEYATTGPGGQLATQAYTWLVANAN